MMAPTPLNLHIPEPRFRPGEKPDFSDLRLSAPGEVRRPAVDAPAAEFRDLADSLIRVLDENRQGIGTTFVTEVAKASDGSFYNKVVKVVPNVNQRLGMSKADFDKVGLGSRDVPNCP